MLSLYTDLEVKVRDFGRRVSRGESGATAVEYGLLVALIAAVIIAVVVLLGNNINTAFTDVQTAIDETQE